MRYRWISWRSDVENIELQFSRCVKDSKFIIQHTSLHHFSDASDIGYGQCSYLRFQSIEGLIHCCLIFGKSRVVSSKSNMPLPRLELLAATLNATIAKFFREELEIKIDEKFYWCDSKVVLGYIKNSMKRFKLFVANRVKAINNATDAMSWHYIPSGMNPADISSRGLKPFFKF